jgi:hypothetical protein
MGFPLYLIGGMAASNSENVLIVRLLSILLFWAYAVKNAPMISETVIRNLI